MPAESPEGFPIRLILVLALPGRDPELELKLSHDWVLVADQERVLEGVPWFMI